MNSKTINILAASILALCVSCSADYTVEDQNAFTMQAPEVLLSARMVNPDALTLTVRVDNLDVEMAQQANGNWTGQVNLTPAVDHRFVVRWDEDFDGQTLLLAQATKSVQVQSGDTTAAVSFRNNEFDTTFDSDSDGRSNLEERENETDPFDAGSPAAPPTEVAVEIQISIPDSLQSAVAVSENLDMVALVNNQSIVLTRTDNRWIGGLTLNENSDAFIRAQLFRDSSRSLRIGEVGISSNVGSGGIVLVPASEFNFDFDDDSDSISNIDELVAGSDPLDSNSPVSDPCDPSPFVAACPNDSDGDGDTDFQEGETNDADNDGIPDYLESNITDADDDAITAEFDPNESDPCIPDPESLACDM